MAETKSEDERIAQIAEKRISDAGLNGVGVYRGPVFRVSANSDDARNIQATEKRLKDQGMDSRVGVSHGSAGDPAPDRFLQSSVLQAGETADGQKLPGVVLADEPEKRKGLPVGKRHSGGKDQAVVLDGEVVLAANQDHPAVVEPKVKAKAPVTPQTGAKVPAVTAPGAPRPRASA
jgi:hypothetical protein